MQDMLNENEKLKSENELLQLRLMNQSKTWTRDQIDANPSTDQFT
jgi:regulator of replication initiation timing